MSKFLLIFSSSSNNDDIKVFSAKYTAQHLKRVTKLDAIQLDDDGDYSAAEDMTGIPESRLSSIANYLQRPKLLKLDNVQPNQARDSKLFVFPDDAELSAFAFATMDQDATFKHFELDESDAIELTEKLAGICDVLEKLSDLNSANGALSELEHVEQMYSLDLLAYDAQESLDTMISDAEDEQEQLQSSVRDFIESGWHS